MELYLFPSDNPESYSDITDHIISGTATIDVSALNTLTFDADMYIPCGYRILLVPDKTRSNWNSPSYAYEFVVVGQRVDAVGTDLTKTSAYNYSYSYTAVSALYCDLSGIVLPKYTDAPYSNIYNYFYELYNQNKTPWLIYYNSPSILPGEYPAGTMWDWLLKTWEYIYDDSIGIYNVPMCNLTTTTMGIVNDQPPIASNRKARQKIVTYDTRTYPSKILDTHSSNVVSFSRNFEQQIIYNNSAPYDKNDTYIGATYGNRRTNQGRYKLKQTLNTVPSTVSIVEYKSSKFVKLPYDFQTELQDARQWMSSNQFRLVDAEPSYSFTLLDGSEYDVGDVVGIITHGLYPVDKATSLLNSLDGVNYVAKKKINLIDGRVQIELGNSVKYQVKMESR